jgi:hypothetical protein
MTPTRLPLLFALLALTGTAACAATLADATGSYSCSFRVFARCGDGSATVKLSGGKVQQVSFENVYCAKAGQPANRCSFDTARGGKDAWTDEGTGVRIEFGNTGKHSRLEDTLLVSLEDHTIVLDLTETQSVTKCSTGVDLPDKLVIDVEAPQCKVEF